MTDKEYFTAQYHLVQKSRKKLFEYCKTITNTDFLNQNISFGRGGSIRNLLVHIANAYEFWVSKHVLEKETIFTSFESQNSIMEVELLFTIIDDIVFEFIDNIDKLQSKTIEVNVSDRTIKTSPFELFTHLITHEFHHKGQILSLSRHLGYVPIDTDIV